MIAAMRHLVLVLGDQLNRDSAAFDDFDPAVDAVWMAEERHESLRVPSSRIRTALFLSAMRHFRDALRGLGWQVDYQPLADSKGSLAKALDAALQRLRPKGVVWVEPGEWQLRAELQAVLERQGLTPEVREDRHFLCSPETFAAHAAGRKQLRMEFFYRQMRREHRVLLDAAGDPEGGEWNFDSDNRKSFGKAGPQRLTDAAPRAFAPDAITRDVLREVAADFPDNPGELDSFDWPVTPAEAELALQDFIQHRLVSFGDYQDAMWADEPWLFHSRLSAAMNLKLLNPRTVIAAAEAEYRAGRAPLAAVEGFIRQILGWREYVRGVYWLHMPGYLERNALGADRPLPEFFWTGDTPMRWLADARGQTLRLG